MIISDAVYVWAGTILILLGAVPSTLFVLVYGVIAPWWRSREGVHLFGFTLTIALLLDLSLVLRLTGQFRGIRIIALAIFLSIAGFMWQRFYLLATAQQLRRRVHIRVRRLRIRAHRTARRLHH